MKFNIEDQVRNVSSGWFGKVIGTNEKQNSSLVFFPKSKQKTWIANNDLSTVKVYTLKELEFIVKYHGFKDVRQTRDGVVFSYKDVSYCIYSVDPEEESYDYCIMDENADVVTSHEYSLNILITNFLETH